MSRSYKKPWSSNTKAGSKSGIEKWFKNYTNRQMRRVKLELPDWVPLSFKNVFTNLWSYPKDGKHYWDKPENHRK